MKLKITSYVGIATAAVFVTSLIMAVSNFPGYNPFNSYLSDLGVGENSSFYFNAGAMTAGILGIIFAVKLPGKMRHTFTLASIGLIGVGFFHSKMQTEHLAFAGIFFIFSAITILLESELRKGNEKYVLAAAGLLPFIFIMTFSPIVEHLAAAGILLFVLCMSVKNK